MRKHALLSMLARAILFLRTKIGWLAVHRKGQKNMTLPNELALAVDDLGILKARIADLVKQENALKALIAASGYAELDGALFRATDSLSERATLNSERVKGFLTPGQIVACTQTAEVTSVRIVARKRAAA
jgi:hypothetical protein